MELRTSDDERARYTRIHGMDPRSREGWLMRRMKHELTVPGAAIAEACDLPVKW